MKKALICGAGGFIGGHLAAYLKKKGYWIRGVDLAPNRFRNLDEIVDHFVLGDLIPAHNFLDNLGDFGNCAGIGDFGGFRGEGLGVPGGVASLDLPTGALTLSVTTGLLALISAANFSFLIFFSLAFWASSSEYGGNQNIA